MAPPEGQLLLTIRVGFLWVLVDAGLTRRADPHRSSMSKGTPVPVETLCLSCHFPGPLSKFTPEPGVDLKCPGLLPMCSNH